VLALAGAHFAHDLYTALLAPWLPLLIRKLSLSLFQAGSLTVFLQLPSLLNPWLGSLVDQRGLTRTLLILAPAVTGGVMSLVGLAPGYGVLVMLLLVGGLSVAALHVSAPVIMAEAAGERTGLGMSFHMLGGQIARTLGPLLAVQAVAWFGLEGCWRVFPVGLAASLLIWWQVGRLPPGKHFERPTRLSEVWRRMRRTIIAVIGLVAARLFIGGAITTFLPTFLVGEGASLWLANIGLSIFAAAGAAGVLTSGALSDKIGRRRVVLGAVCLVPGLMAIFLLAGGGMRLVALVALGCVTLSTTPVLMALMIESAGADRAAANGIFMMIGFSLTALIVPAIGALGDVLGLRGAFWICAAVSALGIPFALFLPADH